MTLASSGPLQWDVLIIGSGPSGSILARELVKAGLKCRIFEAGRAFAPEQYPDNEVDANSRLYWSGGIEFNTDVTIGLLRPKVVGGGSVVNQALLDRFDADALDSWREVSGFERFSVAEMAPWYERAEASVALQKIPEAHWNRNAKIFKEGFEKNGFRCAPLRRAQKDCRYEDGNDCIQCLAGCPIQSKQSMPFTVLKEALNSGLDLQPEHEVVRVTEEPGFASVEVRILKTGATATHRARAVILAAGAIGNTKILIQSGFRERLPRLGEGFYTHPQYMTFAEYADEVNAHKGPLQSLKSDDPNFRRQGFKLENVYAPPVAIAMLLPQIGTAHAAQMLRHRHFACIEVAVRDTSPGRISVSKSGKVAITKNLNAEDLRRKGAGQTAVEAIFRSTGAKALLPGTLAVGLHLMGGLALGLHQNLSCVGPDFSLHYGGKRSRLFAADSSIFPNAPGINPSLTIMALSLMAASSIQERLSRDV